MSVEVEPRGEGVPSEKETDRERELDPAALSKPYPERRIDLGTRLSVVLAVVLSADFVESVVLLSAGHEVTDHRSADGRSGVGCPMVIHVSVFVMTNPSAMEENFSVMGNIFVVLDLIFDSYCYWGLVLSRWIF